MVFSMLFRTVKPLPWRKDPPYWTRLLAITRPLFPFIVTVTPDTLDYYVLALGSARWREFHTPRTALM
jgi:hypothetical protein